MFSSTTGTQNTEQPKKNYPIICNEHKLVPAQKDHGAAKKAQVTLLRVLEDEKDIKQYIEKNMFVKLINFDVVEPDTL